MITFTDIQPKPYKRFGVSYISKNEFGAFNADVVPGKSIRMYGTIYGKDFDMTVKVGDFAEYDSFNLSYYGPITQISAKTVTVIDKQANRIHDRKHRLDLFHFITRNHDFNANEADQKIMRQ